MVISHEKFDYRNKCLIEKVVIQAPFRFAVDFHEEACFIHFSAGEARINSPSGQLPVEPEDSVLLKCGSHFADLLKYGASNTYEILVVHLYPDILRSVYKYEIPSFVKASESNSFFRKVIPDQLIGKFIENLYFYFDNPSLVSDELLELKVKELVLLLIQTKNADSVLQLFSDLFTPRQVNLRDVVNNHLFSGLSLEDLARLASMSVSTFQRSFQASFQQSPANYIRTKRLERAKELLGVSDLSVGEIAFQTGFSDVSHFSRTFKASFRLSPSDYRNSTKA
ncbi:helix-turn-helix transcriptional regulator [Imperialibacter roseus]|uniref:Helix-turn-helix transcriptional regulator n=1 Tax=Imperialibacter roseus TaxID=1324217 RepID=A0ABZ0IU95_9BACT|nr:helix-turn-helix transcriptional regulator [Imperialibacter roseus]WOK07955.1 helix-turn-helix transcriptional regulator [Imperialibacter roseus]